MGAFGSLGSFSPQFWQLMEPQSMPAPNSPGTFPLGIKCPKAVRLGWDESAALILYNKVLLGRMAGMKAAALMHGRWAD